jgi:hypothetical protein
MPIVMRLGEFSLSLKIAWGVWLIASYALIVWRRRARTEFVVQPALPRPRKVKAVKADVPTEKRRWRLRANENAPVISQSGSLLGLQ